MINWKIAVVWVGGGSPPHRHGFGIERWRRGGRFQRLGLEFSKSAGGTGRGAVIRLAYESNGSRYLHHIGLELILCEGEQDPDTGDMPLDCEFAESADYGWHF